MTSPSNKPSDTNAMASTVSVLSSVKVLSLVVLTVQNAAIRIVMRMARTTSGPMFIGSTAVLMAEVVKMLVCILLVFREESYSVSKLSMVLWQVFTKNLVETCLVCVPAAVYFVQNVLLYVAASNLDVATYLMTYQLKIVTTALFAWILLKQTFDKTRMAALLLLLAGVVTVQLSGVEERKVDVESQNRLLGIGAALAAACCSGFAGVFFEKMLKTSELAVLSVPTGLAFAFLTEGEDIMDKGFFYGYTNFVWFVVCLNSVGGLLVALVIKHADNIMKGFASSISILLSGVASYFIFGLSLTSEFCVGTSMVMVSVFMYSQKPAQAKSLPSQGGANGGGGGGTTKVAVQAEKSGSS